MFIVVLPALLLTEICYILYATSPLSPSSLYDTFKFSFMLRDTFVPLWPSAEPAGTSIGLPNLYHKDCCSFAQNFFRYGSANKVEKWGHLKIIFSLGWRKGIGNKGFWFWVQGHIFSCLLIFEAKISMRGLPIFLTIF